MDLFSKNKKISNRQVAKVLGAYLFAMRQKRYEVLRDIYKKFRPEATQKHTAIDRFAVVKHTHNCMVDNLTETIRELESEEQDD